MSPRPSKFSFYLDENFPVRAGEFLQSMGHSVHYAHRETSRGLSDLQQLRHASKNGWTLLTADPDFSHPSFSPRWIKKSHGIIVIESDTLTGNHLERIITKMLREVTPQQAKGRVHRVSIDRVHDIKFESDE